MQHWANGLINSDRTARTVANIWVRAARTVFAWAVDEKLISRNPFIGWRVKVPKKIRTRETKAFTDDEINVILTARTGDPTAQQRRCCQALVSMARGVQRRAHGRAYAIARRRHRRTDGIHAMKISPEAGTTKTGKARTVPLHEHLIEQGFLAFVKANGNGAAVLQRTEATGGVGRSDQSPQAALCKGARALGRMGSEPWRQRSGVVTQPRMAAHVQGYGFPLRHFRKGARCHCRTCARFGRTWLRRADACGQGSRASPIPAVQARWLIDRMTGAAVYERANERNAEIQRFRPAATKPQPICDLAMGIQCCGGPLVLITRRQMMGSWC